MSILYKGIIKDACEYDCDTSYDEIVVTVEEVTNAIKKLDVNKSSESDGICSEHIKYADNALVPLLSMCFISFFAHGFLPVFVSCTCASD